MRHGWYSNSFDFQDDLKSRSRHDPQIVLYALRDTMRTIILSLILLSFLRSEFRHAGRLHLDPPTLENLGFWWSIVGRCESQRPGKCGI